jgi:recombination protein RecT
MAKTTSITPAEQAKTLRGFLEAPAVLGELQKAMPKGLTPQRLVRQVMSLVQHNPGLLECTQLSILSGMMQAAEMGLELTGGLGHAYLVPRWDKRVRAKVAVFQPGWKGLVKLAFQSGNLSAFPVRSVHANDEFYMLLGTENKIRHVPADGERGEVVGYYAVAMYTGGGADFEYMTVDEAKRHREKYSPSAQSGGYSPWDTSFDEMAQKTVVRRLCRRLSLCPQAQEAASRDEADEAQHFQQSLPTPRSRTQQVAGLLEHQLAPESSEASEAQPEGEYVPSASDEQGGV